MPSNSDLIKWAEQGRLHVKYTDVTAATNTSTPGTSDVYTIPDTNANPGGTNPPAFTAQSSMAIRNGQTVIISRTTGAPGLFKAVVSNVDTTNQQFTANYYSATGPAIPASDTDRFTVFIYGSEFKKGDVGMEGSLESDDLFFENKPIIIKDKYSVSGSDMAQIGWVEVTTENGANGYLWYMKSEHETRLRFDDYLETAMIEAVPAAIGSGADDLLGNGATTGATGAGSEGIFYVVNSRGNVYGGGNPTTLADFDTIISRLDKQGAIEENVLFVDRQFSFDIDDMLAAQNSYGAGGTSYGLFDNDKDMALNLGFTGFRRGYDFYKSDWKYLNDPTMRGGLPTATGSGRINGLLVPAGSTSVYDQILGKNAKRPFLHVRYRASETEDRRYKTWITGSAGGAATSSLDAMEVHFLSERAVCTLGANNFFLFEA